MRLHQRNHEAKGLFILADEFTNSCQVMRSGRIPHTTRIKARHLLERKSLGRLHVHLARNPHAITQLTQIMRHARHCRSACGMIPRTAIAHRVLAGEQLRTTRLAHRHTEVGTVERQPLRSQSINVWRLRILPAEQRQIIVRTVIGHDNKDIRLPVRVRREPGNRKAQYNR